MNYNADYDNNGVSGEDDKDDWLADECIWQSTRWLRVQIES